jgi:hypothetical protein
LSATPSCPLQGTGTGGGGLQETSTCPAVLAEAAVRVCAFFNERFTAHASVYMLFLIGDMHGYDPQLLAWI